MNEKKNKVLTNDKVYTLDCGRNNEPAKKIKYNQLNEKLNMKNGSEEEENNGVEKEEKRKWGESRKKQRVRRRKCERSEVYIGRKWEEWREKI